MEFTSCIITHQSLSGNTSDPNPMAALIGIQEVLKTAKRQGKSFFLNAAKTQTIRHKKYKNQFNWYRYRN
jgi:hypothetical protein